jgi:hypothetical protein
MLVERMDGGGQRGEAVFLEPEPLEPCERGIGAQTEQSRQRATRSSIDRPGKACRESSKQPRGQDKTGGRAGRGKM